MSLSTNVINSVALIVLSNACLESWFSLFRRGIKGLIVIVGTNKQLGSGVGRTNKNRGELPTSSPSHLFVIKGRRKSFSKLFGGRDWDCQELFKFELKDIYCPLRDPFSLSDGKFVSHSEKH